MRVLQAVVIAIITTLVGVLVAVLAARHYYARSAKHRLAVYWLPSPSVILDADPDIMSDLSIQFRGEPVKELTVAEFLIANEGADPIRSAIEPLTFVIGDTGRIIDATITYIQPEGREVSVEKITDQEFRCDFVLLNPDEYFYVKVIADGKLRKSMIKCRIVADNLPPVLSVENPGKVSIGSDNESDLPLLFPAGIFLVVAAAIFLPILALFRVHPSYFPFDASKFTFVWWVFLPSVMALIVALLAIVLMVMFTVIAFSGNIRPRRTFNRPRSHSSPYARYARIHSPYVDPDSALVRYPRDQA